MRDTKSPRGDFIKVSEQDKLLSAYEARPASSAKPCPGIIVLSEVFGIKSHIQDACHRLADAGFHAIAPDIYHRLGDLRTCDYEEVTQALTLASQLTNDTLAADVAAMRAYLTRKGATQIGVIGFCLGGLGAYIAATRQMVDFAIIFYGGGLTEARPGLSFTPPLAETRAIQAPLSFYFGRHDSSIPLEHIETLERTLQEHEIKYQITIYDNAGHAFMNFERKSYVPETAEAAWTACLAWLKENHFLLS